MEKTIEAHIESIIEKTFEVIKEVYKTNKEEKTNSIPLNSEMSRILFPITRSNKLRVSEQELRFIFVEQFNIYCKENNCDLFYSVETPTKRAYKGFAAGEPVCCNERGCRSGCIDLVVFDSERNRVCLVEFKANNPRKAEYEKDFLKLNNEGVELGYFLQIIENKKQVEELKERIEKKGNAFYCCLCLGNNEIIKR